MAQSLQDKVFAITGAASGIGLAAAKLLVQRGARRIARHAGIEQTKAVYAQKVDVRNLAQVQLWLEATIEEFGILNGAVNAAGLFDYPTSTLWHKERGIDNFERIIGTNLIGVANCMHAELQCMTRAGESCKSIVNLSSVAGLRAIGGSPAYIAPKHGVVGLTKALAQEYAPVGVRINAVYPGMIKTPMTDCLMNSIGQAAVDGYVHRNPISRMAEATEVAKLIVFLLSDQASYTTGAVHTIDGGMTV